VGKSAAVEHAWTVGWGKQLSAITGGHRSGELPTGVKHHVARCVAEFERDLIRERTNAGLAAARARGRTGGRPPAKAFRNPATLAMARHLYHDTKTPIDAICRQFNISLPTLYRYVGTKRSTAQAAPASEDAAP
jgi:DNA invertase Pin-like site-specific DNA recombinase